MGITNRKTILIVCPYPEDTAPSQRLKYEQYIPYLRSQGYDIEIHPFFNITTYRILYRPGHLVRKLWGVLSGFARRLRLLPRLAAVDGLYIHLNVAPIGPPLLEWLYLKLARRTIYDVDDMVHLLQTSRANRLARLLKSSRRVFLLMAGSDHVITCTPVLDQLAQRFNRHTSDISSTIDTDRYQPCNPYSNDGELTLGWSGSHTTAPYLHLLDHVLQQLANRQRFRLLVMGPASFDLPGVTLEVVPWSAAIELQTLQRIDIGLYPLPNDDWVQGKSGLKALQYMALGIPVIASAVGCNDRVVQHGESGFLVNSEEEWIQALEQLLASPDLRRRFGEQGRKRVEQHYSVRANRRRYLTIFEGVYGHVEFTNETHMDSRVGIAPGER
jgi:glycosyltransferase involved in cell wall biosynthesis